MRQKSWESLLLKARHLDLEIEDRRDLLKEFSVEFENLVREAGGETRLSHVADETKNDHSCAGLVLRDDCAFAGKRESGTGPDGHAEPENSAASPDQEPPVLETDRPEAIRKLWKAIATATHPDKTGNDSKMTAIYKKAGKAWDSGRLEGLIDIAVGLGLPIPMDEELVSYVKKRVSRLETEVREIGSLAIWKWIHAPQDQKAQIVKKVAAYLTRGAAPKAD